MGTIKKLHDSDLKGGITDNDVYPISVTKAIYDENNTKLSDYLFSHSIISASYDNRGNGDLKEYSSFEEVLRDIDTDSYAIGTLLTFKQNDLWYLYVKVLDERNTQVVTECWKYLISSEQISTINNLLTNLSKNITSVKNFTDLLAESINMYQIGKETPTENEEVFMVSYNNEDNGDLSVSLTYPLVNIFGRGDTIGKNTITLSGYNNKLTTVNIYGLAGLYKTFLEGQSIDVNTIAKVFLNFEGPKEFVKAASTNSRIINFETQNYQDVVTGQFVHNKSPRGDCSNLFVYKPCATLQNLGYIMLNHDIITIERSTNTLTFYKENVTYIFTYDALNNWVGVNFKSMGKEIIAAFANANLI